MSELHGRVLSAALSACERELAQIEQLYAEACSGRGNFQYLQHKYLIELTRDLGHRREQVLARLERLVAVAQRPGCECKNE